MTLTLVADPQSEERVIPVVKFEIRHGIRALAKLEAIEKEIASLENFLADLKHECQRLKQRTEELRKRGAA